MFNRKSLRHTKARVQPLPEPSSYAKAGGYAFQKQKLAVNAVNGTGTGKKQGGWKKFSLGIGLGAIPDDIK